MAYFPSTDIVAGIPPFWHRLLYFFRYPFNLRLFPILLGLSFSISVAFFMWIQPYTESLAAVEKPIQEMQQEIKELQKKLPPDVQRKVEKMQRNHIDPYVVAHMPRELQKEMWEIQKRKDEKLKQIPQKLTMHQQLTNNILGLIFFMFAGLGSSYVFFYYAFKVMGQTSQGLLESKDSAKFTREGIFFLPLKAFLYALVTLIIIGIPGIVHPILFALLLIPWALLLPANMMALSATGSFFSTLSPINALSTIRSIGSQYIGLLLFLFLLQVTQSTLQFFVLYAAGTLYVSSAMIVTAYTIICFLGMYFMTVQCHVMGYVIYQHHNELGVDTYDSQEDLSKETASGKSGEMIKQLSADGNIDQALKLAFEAQQNSDDITVHECYHMQLIQAQRTAPMLAHAHRYLTLLLSKKEKTKALKLYATALENSPEFEPEQPEQLVKLAEAAYQAKEYKQSLSLLKGYDKRFPHSKAVPMAYFLAAKIFGEQFHQHESALKILSVLLERYPNHPVSSKAVQLQEVLEIRKTNCLN